jgi:hypothetical protein
MAPKPNKKESGAAKKAKNEADKRAAAEEAKVSPPYSILLLNCKLFYRNEKRLPNGKMERDLARARRRNRRSAMQTVLGRRRAHDYLPKKKRLLHQKRRMHQRQARRNQPTLNTNPHAQVQSLPAAGSTLLLRRHKAPVRVMTNPRRSRSFRQLGSTMPLICWMSSLQRRTRRALEIRRQVLKDTQK